MEGGDKFMSKTVDKRIVEMRFDNQQFEQGVQTTMNTLDKLKQSLKLNDATKGFENIDNASRKVSFDSITAGVEALQKRFSTFGIVGMRVIENLTDSLMGFANNTIGFVTDSIINGGKRRAMNIENAHFQLQGLLKDEARVQAVMKDAMDSVDGTAYAYDEAAKAASQFAASGMEAGRDMQSSLRAITGVAAMTNSAYEDISRVFTTVAGNGRLMGDQLLQLSSRGLNAAATIKDYFNKVNNGTIQANETVTEAIKNLTSGLEVTEGDIRDFVSDGELSFQMFAAAMDDAFGEHAKKANETFTGAMSNVKAALARIGAEFISPLVVQNGALVKFFNVLRERINDIKASIGPLAELFVNSVTTMANAATNFLEKFDVKIYFEKFKAFSSKKSIWTQISDKINAAGISMDVFEDKFKMAAVEHGVAIDKIIEEEGSLATAIGNGKVSGNIIIETLKNFTAESLNASSATSEITDKITNLQEVVEKVIRGEFGNGEERIKALVEAGYDYADVQDLVDKKLNGEIIEFEELSDAQLKSIGYTEEQIEVIRNLAEEAQTANTPLSKLISELDRPSGAEILIDSARNALQGITKIINSVRTAWKDIFTPATADTLYNIINTLHSFSKHLIISDEDTNNLKSTFKGLFAILDIGKQIFGSLLKAIFPIAKGLGNFGSGILSITGTIGEWLVVLDRVVKSSDIFNKAIQKMQNILSPIFKFISDRINGAIKAIKEFAQIHFSVPDTSEFMSFTDKLQGRFEPFKKIGEVAKVVMDKIAEVFKASAPVLARLGNMIVDTLGKVCDGIVKALHGEGFDSLIDLLNGSMMVGIGAGILKFMENLQANINRAGGMFSHVNRILFNVKNTLISYQAGLKADVLMKIAKAIAVLAASLLVLSLIDSDKLGGAIVAISILFGELATSMAIFDTTLNDKKTLKLSAVGLVMVEMSAAILVLASALKKIASIDSNKLIGALAGVTVLIHELIATALILSKWGGKIQTSAVSMILFAEAINILAKAVRKLGELDTKVLIQGLVGVGILMGELVITFNSFKYGDSLKIAMSMLIMSTALTIMGGALKIIGSTSMLEIGKALLGIAGTMVILVKAFNGFKYGDSLKVASAMFVMSTALTIMGGALKIIGATSLLEIGKALLGIAGTMAILVIAFNAFKYDDSLKVAASMFVMSTALVIMGRVLKIIGSMSLAEIGKALLALAGACTILGIAGAVLAPVIPAIIGLSGALALLGVAVAACGVGLLAFATGLVSLSVSGVAGVTALVEALKILIVGVLDIIASHAKAIAKAVKAVILAVIDVIVECAPAIVEGVLVLINEILKALAEYAPSIVTYLMDFLIGVINALADKLPELIKAAVNLIGAFFRGIVDAFKEIDTTTLIEGLMGIGILSAIMLALSVVAKLIPSAMIGVLGMGIVIAELALVIAAIGAFAQLPGLKWLIEEGGDLLQGVGTAIGKFVGGIVGGFMEGVSAQFPKIGKDLTDFMTNVQGFLDGAKQVDSTMLEGVNSLAKVILRLTAANVLDGLTKWFTGGSSLTKFGAELAEFGPYFKKYADEVTGIDSEVIVASSNAALALAEMASKLPNSGGLAGKIFGENNLSDFGAELEKFGPYIKQYGEDVSGLKSEAVVASAEAAQVLSDMASTLPNAGGLAAKILGDNTLSAFGEELKKFGPLISQYAKDVDGVNPETVKTSAEAAQVLSDMASTLPNAGGLAAKILGDNTLSAFGEELKKFGPHISQYAKDVADVKPEVVNASANAAKALSELANNLPNSGGLVSWFTGDNDIGEFGESLEKFGKLFAKYYDSISGINTVLLDSAIVELDKLVNIAKDISGIDTSSMVRFSQNLQAMGDNGIDSFIQAFTGATIKIQQGVAVLISTLTSAMLSQISTLQTLGDITGQSLIIAIMNGITVKKILLVNLITVLCTSIIQIIRKELPDSLFNMIGKNVVQELINGMKSRQDEIKEVLKIVCVSIKNELIDNLSVNDLREIGENAAQGLADGIANKTDKIANAAISAAKTAVEMAKKELEVHSPSRVFFEIGENVDQGLVNGILAYLSCVSDAGTKLGSNTVRSMKFAMDNVADTIDREMNVNPTITPVLDLSNIQNGIAQINRLGGQTRGFGISTSVDLANQTARDMTYTKLNNKMDSHSIGELKDTIQKLNNTNNQVIENTFHINGNNPKEIAEEVSKIIQQQVERRGASWA